MRFFAAALVLLAAVQPAAAQSLLRDTETEREIRRMITPILLAAELEPDAVSLFLISDQSINAFVAGGQNIFMHSGLILNATNVNQVLGVLAHEAGHISGGHIVRFQDGARGASAISIISMLLGAAAIAAGSPDAGIA
ncbi:MAG: M48 family metalloprotease, partial [Sphingomonadales bacterium]|nr:M48 family metalloprotease [Sphingomonadales bacterium]